MAKFSSELIHECANWVRENGLMEYGGAKLKDFCAYFGIDNKTYYKWMTKSEFSDAIKKAKDYFKKSLERDIVFSLAKAAKGHEYEQITTEYVKNGKGDANVRKQVRKVIKNVHVEPNVGAAIFLLCNINPGKWQNNRYSNDNDESNESRIEFIFKESIIEKSNGKKETEK